MRNEVEETSQELPEELLRQTDEPAQPEAAQPADELADAESVEDRNQRVKMTLHNLLSGELLTHDFFQRQVKLLVFVVFLGLIYIANGYSYQQEMIEIDRLKKELVDMKYDALTRSAELAEKSRRSHIEEYVLREGSELQTATTLPYLIK